MVIQKPNPIPNYPSVFQPMMVINNYEFYISKDNAEWKLANASEFSNIKSNPLLQIKKIVMEEVRCIKPRILSNQSKDEGSLLELSIPRLYLLFNFSELLTDMKNIK